MAANTLKTLEILPWSEACTRMYGRLSADLERYGKALAAMDLLIACHAMNEGCQGASSIMKDTACGGK